MGKTMKKIVTGIAFATTLCFGNIALASDYTVSAGDNLWKIAGHYQISVDEIKALNNLSSDTIYVGQTLKLAGNPALIGAVVKDIATSNKTTLNVTPTLALSSGSTYSVQPGDSPYRIAQKFGIQVADLLKFNQLKETDIIYPGQKIAIPNQAKPVPMAPQNTTQVPSSPAPTITASNTLTGKGQLVDWFAEGRSLLKAGEIITIVDIGAQKQFLVKILSAGNHADVEPLTRQDTATMLQIFGSWQWQPRPVVIVKDGRRIAGSISGKPHDISTIKDNGVDGHFDLYLHNSQPHGSGISRSYVQQHRDAVIRATGQR